MTTTDPTITFRQAAENDACQEGMDAMARRMGYPDGYHAGLADVEVPIADVLTVLGLGDALTCLEWVGEDRSLRLFAADCAERVVHLTGADPRCLLAIRVARLYAHGLASDEELRIARTAADNAYAASAAANAPTYAAYSAAADAANAVRAAAYAAASAANAAYSATYAANAAYSATYAANAADATNAAERDWQRTRLRWYLTHGYPRAASSFAASSEDAQP